MSKIAPLPAVIIPNTLADATQVEANFLSLVSQINLTTDLVLFGSYVNPPSGNVFTPMTVSAAINDVNGEVLGNSFIPKVAGTYLIMGAMQFVTTNTTTGITGQIITWSTIMEPGPSTPFSRGETWPYATQPGFLDFYICSTVPMTVGTSIGFGVQVSSYGGGAPSALINGISIRRIA